MNNKRFHFFPLLTGLALMTSGCFNEAPNFPETPSIFTEDVEFREAVGIQDSLIITIRYQDGNGDLGIDDTFAEDIYAPGFFYSFPNGDTISIKDIGEPINIPDFDGNVVPPYERPYQCENWIETPTLSGIVIQDTLFYVPNPNNFNIFVKLFHRPIGSDNSVPFEEFDFVGGESLPSCGSPIDGRFPVLKDPSESDAPIEGELRYAIVNSGFISEFSNSQIKLEVQIQDRALNKSNTITITGRGDDDNGVGFTLAQIRTN